MPSKENVILNKGGGVGMTNEEAAALLTRVHGELSELQIGSIMDIPEEELLALKMGAAALRENPGLREENEMLRLEIIGLKRELKSLQMFYIKIGPRKRKMISGKHRIDVLMDEREEENVNNDE